MGAAGIYYTLVTSVLAILTSKTTYGSRNSADRHGWVWKVRVFPCAAVVCRPPSKAYL